MEHVCDLVERIGKFGSYVYTGQLNTEELDDDTILEVLGIAHLYGLEKLERMLHLYLKEHLSIVNVCALYGKVHRLNFEELRELCKKIMTEDPNAILENENFYDLSESAFVDAVSLGTFCVDELEIFKAVVQWRTKHPTHADLSNVLRTIRLPLIDTMNLATIVKDSNLIPENLLWDAVRTRKSHTKDIKFRGFLASDVNLACSDRGALKLTPRPQGNYVSATTSPVYDGEEIPPYPTMIDSDAGTGLTVALGKPYFVNHVAFRLHPWAMYCVEVSVNLKNWTRVIDNTRFGCQNSQELYFESRVVRYIRVICGSEICEPSDAESDNAKPGQTEPGDAVSDNAELGDAASNQESDQLSAFEVLYTTEPFNIRCGFYAPEENVATAALGAEVYVGDEKSEGMITKETSDDSGGSLWTTHEIGKNFIEIRLPQLFTVDSMRMLLRSDESQEYNYYIETTLYYNNNKSRITPVNLVARGSTSPSKLARCFLY